MFPNTVQLRLKVALDECRGHSLTGGADIAVKSIFCDCQAVEHAVRRELDAMLAVKELPGCLSCGGAHYDLNSGGENGLRYLLSMKCVTKAVLRTAAISSQQHGGSRCRALMWYYMSLDASLGDGRARVYAKQMHAEHAERFAMPLLVV